MTVAPGHLWMIYLGVESLRQGWYRQFYRTSRVDLILFQFGVHLLEHMLNHGGPLLMAFSLPHLHISQTVR
jgi:hypothetical protein